MFHNTCGSKYIKKLSQDLCKYGKGCSIQNLKNMGQLASESDENEFSQQPVGQILWGTLVTVIIPCKDSDSFVAKTSINKVDLKLGISKYKIIKDLPEYLEKRMKEIEYYKKD